MTQQPFYPQYPQAPAPGYPQQGYPQPQQPQFPGYPQQGFPQQAAPQQPPAQPLVQGTLDDFYNQPTTGGGPSLSWSNKDQSKKPIGTSYMGIVTRDVTNGDVQQQINFQSKQPEFYRDGRPKFVMKVPLKQVVLIDPNGQAFSDPDFPEGEAAFYVRGQARDELARAMAEAQASGAPKAGDVIKVTLTQRKPSGQGMNPANVVQISYQPASGSSSGAPSPAPEQASQPQPVQQPIPQPVQPPGQQFANVGQVVGQQPIPQPAPQVQQPVQQQGAPQPPAGLSDEQQQLLARITGQAQG